MITRIKHHILPCSLLAAFAYVMSMCTEPKIHDEEAYIMIDDARQCIEEGRYDEAEAMADSIARHTHNDIVRLQCDIVMMRVCRATDRCKEYYAYDEDAALRARNINLPGIECDAQDEGHRLLALNDYQMIHMDRLDEHGDMEQEHYMAQRIETLTNRQHHIELALYVLLAVITVTLILVVFLSHKMKAKSRRQTAELEEELSRAESEWRHALSEKSKEYDEHVESLNDEISMHQHELDEGKRMFVYRSAAVNILTDITPLIERAKHQANAKSTQGDTYLRELMLKIQQYMDTLGHWVKIRQGVISPAISSFSLQNIFDTVGGAQNVFAAKHQTLTVSEAPYMIKGDESLTLFMINTLMDNARKYTPEGGEVTLSAKEGDGYVEVSVQDSGYGIADEDLNMLLYEKVYDSSQVGAKNADVVGSKGFGFGLMNCRGIIEKYRKLSRIFDVCMFGAESKQGEGSRFFFRMPLARQSQRMRSGVMQMLLLCISFLSFAQPSWANDDGVAISDMAQRVGLMQEHVERLETIFTLLALFSLISIVVYTLYYYKRYLLYRFNLRQISQYLRELSTTDAPESLTWHAINDIHPIDSLCLVFINEKGVPVVRTHSKSGGDSELEALVREAATEYSDDKYVLRLAIDVEGEERVLGAIGVRLHSGRIKSHEKVLFRRLAHYISIHIYYNQVLRRQHNLDIEFIEDECRRVEMEAQRIHVRNLILDNVLSAAKHETLYYPARIIAEIGNTDLATLDYYSNIHSILTRQCVAQTNVSIVRMGAVLVMQLAHRLQSSLEKRCQNVGLKLDFNLEGEHSGRTVRTDENLANYMMEILANIVVDNARNALSCDGGVRNTSSSPVVVTLSVDYAQSITTFALRGVGLHISEAEGTNIFHPDSLVYDAATDTLVGTNYLLIKQIIRILDQHSATRGLRVWVEDDSLRFTCQS